MEYNGVVKVGISVHDAVKMIVISDARIIMCKVLLIMLFELLFHIKTPKTTLVNGLGKALMKRILGKLRDVINVNKALKVGTIFEVNLLRK